MSEPTFEYPKPEDRHVFIKCDKNDPQRGEFWCSRFAYNQGGWRPVSRADDEWHHSCQEANCQQIWRKRVEVPAGWAIIPENEIPSAGDKVLVSTGEWDVIFNDHNYTIKDWNKIVCSKHLYIFIRPIAATWDARAILNRKEAEQFSEINPYAVTIRGHTFDYYDFCHANQMVNQPIAHAFKKLWRLGKSHKPARQDLQEAIRSLNRALEMEEGR